MSRDQLVVGQSLKIPSDQEQRDLAINPTGSYIVQAPAGSGKTTLLVNRYLALLATANEPEEILAITFTKKAAEEMRVRVLGLLRNDPNAAAKAVLKRSEERDWKLLESSNRMRIQTIDSFQHSLVQRLPYHSQHSMDYGLVANADELYQTAAENVIQRIAGQRERFGDEIASMLAAFDNNAEQFAKELAKMLQKREQWIDAAVGVASAELSENSADEIFEMLQQTRKDFCDTRKAQFLEAIENDQNLWDRLQKLTRHHMANRTKDPEVFSDMTSPSDWTGLVSLALTNEGKWRRRVTSREGFSDKEGPNSKKAYWDAMDALREFPNTRQTIEKLKNLPPDELSKDLRQSLTDFALTLVACLEELLALFESTGNVDFTERAIAARRALRVDDAPTQLALALDYRIRHILVDEYQDTSIAQNDLLNLLMEGWEPDEGNTFFAVGDPMQSIYGFRDADLRNFLYADNGGIKHRQLQKLQLSANFRSTKSLVNWCNDTFQSVFGNENDAELGKVAFAPSEAMSPSEDHADINIRLFESDTRYLEAESVAQKVLEIKKKFKGQTIALLVRKRDVVTEIYEAFRRNNVRWRDVEMESLYDIGVVRDLLALTSAILDAEDDLHWATVLTCPLVGVDLHDLELIYREHRGRQAVLETPPQGISELSEKILNRIRVPINEALTNHERTLRTRVERLWYQLGGANAYQTIDDPTSVVTVKKHAKHFFETLESITHDHIDSQVLEVLLKSKLASSSQPEQDVEVMTVHKAKGLEFEHVLMPALGKKGQSSRSEPFYAKPTPENEVLISIKNNLVVDDMHAIMFDIEKAKDKNEIARQFYVGATRAKNSLTLFATVEDREKKRPSASYVDLMLADDYENDENWTIAPEETEPEETTAAPQIWRRIDPDFEFQPPKTLPSFNRSALVTFNQREAILKDIDVNNVALAIGQIVHEALQWMVEDGSSELLSTHRIEKWRNELQAGGFAARQIAEMLETIQDQLRKTIDSPTGKWLLDRNHLDSQVEQPFTDYSDGSQRTFVVDRTFVDEGTRWIVDYKTSMIPDNSSLSLEEKAKNHEPQLRNYTNIYRQLEDRPIKTAIFFTDIATLVEVEINEEFPSLDEDAGFLDDRTFKSPVLLED